MYYLLKVIKLSIVLSLFFFSYSSHSASCNSAATVVSDIWKEFRVAAESVGCKSPLGGHIEYAACGVERFVHETTEDIVGWWNTVAKNRWATMGPRILGAEEELGTILIGTKRTFVSMVPSFNKGKIIVTSRSGKGDVTICTTDDKGKTEKIVNEVQVKGGSKTFDISKVKAEGKVLAVILNARSPEFAYSIKKAETPIKWHYGKITGLADLHVHQAANLGFAGLWCRGDHDGPQSEALRSCRAINATDAASVIGQIKGLPVAEKEKLHALPFNEAKHEAEEVLRHGNGFTNSSNTFADWPHFTDIAHQQVHADWLKEAHQKGLKLVIVSAVNNEILCRGLRLAFYPGKNDYSCDDMSNIKRQIEAFVAFDKKYDWYEIALHPWHARKIIHENKLAVIVSAESSHMLPASEGDFKKQFDELYRMGLRSLQLVHERDNRFAGAAPHRKNFIPHQITSNPFTTAKAWIEGDKFDDHWLGSFDLDDNGKNRKGLLGPGYELIDAMVQRRTLIDVSHYSGKAINDLTTLVKTKYSNYPFFASHTRFRARLAGVERDILKEFLTTNKQAKAIAAVGGIIGLRTGPNHITKDRDFDSGVANDCAGSSKSYAQLVAHGKKLGVAIAFGTDFNGVTQQIGPRYGSEEDTCYAAEKTGRGEKQPQGPKPKGVANRFNRDGLRHIGYLPDLYDDLKALNTTGVEVLNDGVENTLQMWEKAYGTFVPVTVNTGCKNDKQCEDGEWCDAGVDLKSNVCRAKRKNGEACPAIGGAHACEFGNCKFGRCYKSSSVSLGGACFVNEQCRVGKCGNTVPGTDAICVCDDDGQCGDGKYCDKGLDLKQNSCKELKNDNESCALVDGGRTCKGGKCKLSRCYTPKSVPLGGTCYVDDACTKGKCSSIDGTKGSCVCHSDSQCGSDFWCDKGIDTKKNSCKKKLNKGEVCGTAGELSVGHRCKSGKCKVSGLSTKLKCQ